MKVKRLLVSRGAVVAVIASAAGLMIVASLVPQAFMTPPDEMAAWQADHPTLARLVSTLGLDRVYTHPVFAAVLAWAVVALATSTLDQLRTAWRRSRPRSVPGGDGVELPASVDVVARELRRRGYLTVRRLTDARVLVRHPWGYWGNFLLHAGLLLVVAASTWIGLTQQRGALHLVEGATHQPTMPWFVEENGVAATQLELPFAVRLDRLEPRFRAEGGLVSATSTLSLLRADGPTTTLRVSIEALAEVEGLTIYQGTEVGHAFTVEVARGGGSARLSLLMPHPPDAVTAGYNEFRDLLPAGQVLRAKYLVDAERRSLDTFNPLLTLRISQGPASLGEIELRPGTSGEVGPYELRLVKVALWARLFFVRIHGILGVFIGFFIIALGGLLHYFTPPREAALTVTAGGGTRMVWRATRFASFYEDEREAIVAAFGPGETRD